MYFLIVNRWGTIFSEVTCEPSNLYKFRKIDITELENIVKQRKDKPDHECVSNKIIIDNWNVLGNILLRIINTSLETYISEKLEEINDNTHGKSAPDKKMLGIST